MNVRAIVFSRDRAAQLDLLLSSLRANAPGLLDSVTVLWLASDDLYRQAYGTCAEEHPDVEFVVEHSFADDVRSLLAPAELVVFFTDDSVLFRSLEDRGRTPQEWLADDPELLCFSLRLGRNCEECYPNGCRQRMPDFASHADGLSWTWGGADCDFGYPMSLDGHIMEAEVPRTILGSQRPTNPNELEALLANAVGAARVAPRMASYDESHLVCIPANRVNETHPNRFDSSSGAEPHLLNARYLAGERLDREAIDFGSVSAAHAELRLAWKAPGRSSSSESPKTAGGVLAADEEEPGENPVIRTFAFAQPHPPTHRGDP